MSTVIKNSHTCRQDPDLAFQKPVQVQVSPPSTPSLTASAAVRRPLVFPSHETPSLRLSPIKESQVRAIVNTKQSEAKTNYIHRRTHTDRIFLSPFSSGCDADREQVCSLSGAALFSHLMSCHCVKSFILTWQRKRPRL